MSKKSKQTKTSTKTTKQARLSVEATVKAGVAPREDGGGCTPNPFDKLRPR